MKIYSFKNVYNSESTCKGLETSVLVSFSDACNVRLRTNGTGVAYT